MGHETVWLPSNEPLKQSVLRDIISVFIIQYLNF